MTAAAGERFIGEALRPLQEDWDPQSMAAGSPGLPSAFLWGGRTLRLAALVRTWKDTGPCGHGSGERYVRRHWFEVRTTEGEVLKLYFERQRRRGTVQSRWWLFSLAGGDSGRSGP